MRQIIAHYLRFVKCVTQNTKKRELTLQEPSTAAGKVNPLRGSRHKCSAPQEGRPQRSLCDGLQDDDHDAPRRRDIDFVAYDDDSVRAIRRAVNCRISPCNKFTIDINVIA